MEVVRALISAGADWSKRNMDGRTALDLATSCGHQEVIPLLEQAAHKKGKRKKVKASKKRK